MNRLREKAGTVNWDDDSEDEEEQDEPPVAAPVKRKGSAAPAAPPPTSARQRSAPPVASTRRGAAAAPHSDDEDEEEEEEDDTPATSEAEDSDKSSVSLMSDSGAAGHRGGAARGAASSEDDTTSSDEEDEEGESDDSERVESERGKAQGLRAAGAGSGGASFSRLSSGGGRGGGAAAPRVATARSDGGHIDWALVERQLAAVPPPFKQPAFDPVPHVVEILNAAHPETELDKLQDLQVSIDGLVTDVVAAYSTGFSRALQNYSRILGLFTEGSTHISKATRNLDEAGTHLSSRKPALQAQWLRAATAAAVCRTLDSVANCCSYEDRVAACLRDNRPGDAVTALLETAAALEREDMRAVPGLRGLRLNLAARKGSLFDELLSRLAARIYDANGAAASASDDALLGGVPGRTSFNALASSASAAPQHLNPLTAAAAPSATATQTDRSKTPTDAGFSGLQMGLAQFRAAAAAATASAAAPPSGEDASQAEPGAMQPSSGVSLEELVDAMLRLCTPAESGVGGAAAVRDALAQKHGDALRGLIASHLARAVPRSSKGGGGSHSSSLANALRSAGNGPPSQALLLAVADSPAVEALENVCVACLDALRAYLRAQRRVVESPSAWQHVKGNLTGTPPSMAYKQEAVRAWTLTQAEIERLLAAMLAHPPVPGVAKNAQLRGAAAIAARKAAAEAAANAKVRAAEAAGAQALAHAGEFTFGLADQLVGALHLPAPSTAAASAQTAGVVNTGDANTAESPLAVTQDSYMTAAALLPGCGPHLAPFATAPVMRLGDAIAAEFPECTGAGDDVMLTLPPGAVSSSSGSATAAPVVESSKSARFGKSGSSRFKRGGSSKAKAETAGLVPP